MQDYFNRVVHLNTILGRTDGLTQPNAQNAAQWIEKIECDLSPENLTCDGELGRAEVNRRSAQLHKALTHCQNLLLARGIFGSTVAANGAKDGMPFYPMPMSYKHLDAERRRKRTEDRQAKLNTAVDNGFKIGAKVLLRNGVRGIIVKINRTRVKVAAHSTGKEWMVPPSCMILDTSA